MGRKNIVALKLRLTLNTNGSDMEVLKKYGKVNDGIIREIIVPGDITLHALHYVIQRAFGWQNSHLHHFELPETVFAALTQNSFMRWADFCGLYFRFPFEDFEDIYGDDDYDGRVSPKTWFKRKYTGPYLFHCKSEMFYVAKKALYSLLNENEEMPVSPSFEEFMKMSDAERENLRQHPRIKKIEDVTVDEMRMLFAEATGLDELLERLKLAELLGDAASSEELQNLVDNANAASEALRKPAKRGGVMPFDAKILPLTGELTYEYDYGDGWEVKIELVDEYGCDDLSDEQLILRKKDGAAVEEGLTQQIITVLSNQRPLCVMLDGLPVLDDVGGIYGYCEMLKGIHGNKSDNSDFDNSEETREWLRMQEWTGRMPKPEALL